MTDLAFGWESLLHTDAPPGCSLQAALFTTYDRADERLLVEHLLPALLRLNREPDGDGKERQLFLLELDRRLKQLHDRLVVISSTSREEAAGPDDGESGCYAWIWGSIRQLTVGSERKAVQHAKLWLLHWRAADGEGDHLEIVVSSSNLTTNAFKGQVQAAWRACVVLRPQRSDARLGAWGMLPTFLRALAASAGDPGRLESFVELLARAECPAGVSFVASVPGTHSRAALRRTPWGAAGLAKIAPPGRGNVAISILSPYIGAWTSGTLTEWCARFDGSPARLGLVWIGWHHPWAVGRRWLLPRSSLEALSEAGATLLQLRHDSDDPDRRDALHEEHRPADDRWSHAKIYGLRRGTSRRLLVTSANFSTSAWGAEGSDGALTIENFELGVCVDGTAWPFEGLEAFDDARDVATVPDTPGRGSSRISWARAVWDGKNVEVACRCEAGAALVGWIKAGDRWIDVEPWTTASGQRLRTANVACDDANAAPSSARLTCEDETVTVPIFDARPAVDRDLMTPFEVDEEAAQAMRDQLLFEQYGGRLATEDEEEEPAPSSAGDDQPDAPEEPTADTPGQPEIGAPGAAGEDVVEDVETGSGDSYAVPAFVRARHQLSVVDNWAGRVKSLGKRATAALEHEWLQRDGNLLVDAFRRQVEREEKAAPSRPSGARLAVEELEVRLKHFPEA